MLVRARGVEPPPPKGPGPKPGASAIPPRPLGSRRGRQSVGAVGWRSGHSAPLRPGCSGWVARNGSLVAMVTDPNNPVLRSAGSAMDSTADVYQRLLKERIVFLGNAIDQHTANL